MPDWRHAIERRLAPLRLAPTREAEVVEELAQHLDDRYEEMRAAGVPDDEARRDALAELDDADLVRELTGIAPPAAEPLALGGAPQAQVFGGVWQDIRFGVRLLVKDAGASLVIVLTLGLAIAANTIVFGFTDLLLLRPLPIGNTDRLVTIYVFDPRQGQDRQRANIRDYLEIKAQSTLFEDVLAMKRGQQVSLTGSGDPLAVAAAPVTANLFHLWNVAPFAGRLLLPGEDVAWTQPGGGARASFLEGALCRRSRDRRPRRHLERPQLQCRGCRHARDRNRQHSARSTSGCHSTPASPRVATSDR